MPEQVEPAAIRKRVIYSGRVQGVGFRATCAYIARNFKVGGSVRNLRDGTVELEAEGPPPEVERFLAAVAREFEGYIHHTTVTDLPPRADTPPLRITY